MSIKISGPFRPVGKMKMRSAILVPAFLTNPSIQSVDLYTGSVFTAFDGTYLAGKTIVSRRWLLDGVSIGTGSTVIPQVPGNLALEVTLTNAAGIVKTTTAAIAIVSPIPVFTAQPSIQYPDLYSDSTMTAVDGTFTPSTAVVTRRWLLNNVVVGTGPTIVTSNAGSLVLEVTITTPGGTAKATTSPLSITTFPAPSFTVNPSITPGSGGYGTLFTANAGTFVNGTVSSKYWYINGNKDTSITGVSYTPSVVTTMAYEVTLTGRGGTTTRTSTVVTATAPAPVFTTDPGISPNGGQMGTTFTGTNGTYTNTTSVSHQWVLNGVVVNGQTASTYISDGTGTLVYRVTITGSGGTVVKDSPAVVVSPTPAPQDPPVFVTLPGLLGTYAEGSAISIPIQASDPQNNISSYSIVGGQLPAGLVLDTFTGTISGTLPEVVADTTYSFTVKVSDRTNLSATGVFSINVANVKSTVTWQTSNSSDLADVSPGQYISTQVGAKSS